jgi:hypothetical protein
MFNKKSRSERSFSVMLAEELLRAELKKLYGDEIKFFQCDIVASPVSETVPDHHTMTLAEENCLGHFQPKEWIIERHVEIVAIIGPFERLYPENPPNDRRRRLRRIEAACRVFSSEPGCIHWQTHFLTFSVKDDSGNTITVIERYYKDGRVRGARVCGKAENPCKIMSDSQTDANYPRIYPKLHGLAK